ncbi:HyaD/HybD family hydrogenase maturation endopeptidase [Rummeliibacillus pycnus]|uniref:HyaD/HybD family hydrogenase maturation endopeptidase n=1 Tax=Rummeliibacillus pycnus TaxID=101070 RepID=UPI0037C80F34
MTNNNRKQITILGIGNTLYSDEGLGVYALSPLEKLYGNDDQVELVYGATDGMSLLGVVEDTDYLMVLDAINAGKEGGHIIQLQGDEIPAYYGVKMSIHQLGFQEVLLASKLRERFPKHLVMIGMQPTSLELSVGLTTTNESKLPELVQLVERQINKWKNDLA